MAVDIVDASGAQIGRAVQQDRGDLLGRQVGGVLHQHRRRTRHDWRGEAGASRQRHAAADIRRQDLVAGGHQEVVLRDAGLVAEAGDDVVGIDRTDRQHTADTAGNAAEVGRGIDFAGAFVTGGGHDQHIVAGGIGSGVGDHLAQAAGGTHAEVDNAGAVIGRVGDAVSDVLRLEAAMRADAVDRVGAHRQNGRAERDALGQIARSGGPPPYRPPRCRAG